MAGSDTPSHGATHGPVRVFKGVKIEPYYPPSTLKTFGAGIDHPLSKDPHSSVEKAALAFVREQLNFDDTSIRLRKTVSSAVAHHVDIDQVHDGIPFSNVRANVSFNLRNKVVAFGSSFVKLDWSNIASSKPKVSLDDAIKFAQDILDGKFNDKLRHPDPTQHLRYVARKDGSAVLTYILRISNENEVASTCFDAYVNANSEPGKLELVSITDHVCRASYRILPIQTQLPQADDDFVLCENPANEDASPRGWHSTGGDNSTDTSGNNAIVYKGPDTAAVQSQQSADGLVFDYAQNRAVAPNDATSTNVDAARVNAFYVVNTMHDIAYLYGFDEAYDNFQQMNFKDGEATAGEGRLRVRVQFRESAENGEFIDDNPARIELHLCTQRLQGQVLLSRDASFANDIIIHEFTHGIVRRMTGDDVMLTLEALGLEEGLCDTMAWWIARSEGHDPAFPNYAFGRYLKPNSPTGIRTIAYSIQSNLKYSDARDLVSSELHLRHDVGEIWATILYKVYAHLVTARGFSKNARNNSKGTGGNVVFLNLFMDALSALRVIPTFVELRELWIQADETRYGGDHKDILWTAFAASGLGANADNFVDSDVVE